VSGHRRQKPAVSLIADVTRQLFFKVVISDVLCDNSQLPMALKGIKASKLIRKKSKAKLVEWKARERSRGTRYVPVEVSTSKNQGIPGRDAVRMEIDNSEAVSHEADPPSMDVDGSFWIGGPNVREQRRVR